MAGPCSALPMAWEHAACALAAIAGLASVCHWRWSRDGTGFEGLHGDRVLETTFSMSLPAGPGSDFIGKA